MVVEAGVVALHPADQPDRQVLVQHELLEAALLRAVAHQGPPQPGAGGEGGDHRTQLVARQIALEVVDRHAASSWRSGSAMRAPFSAAATAQSGLGQRAGLDQRPVRAVGELAHPDHAPDGLRRARPVRGGLVVQAGVGHARGGAAARGEALDVQRRGAGEQREHDAQLRVVQAADGHEGVPGGVHLRHVGGQRGPPAAALAGRTGSAGGSHGDGPGWTNSGASRRSRRSSSGPQRSRPARVASALAGSVRPTRPRSSSASTASGSGSASADRAPGRELAAERVDAGVEGGDQGLRLVGGQALDAERASRARRARGRAPSCRTSAARASTSSLAGSSGYGGSPATSSSQRSPSRRRRGGSRASGERGAQRLAQQVLVHVDARGMAVLNPIISTKILEIRTECRARRGGGAARR